MADEEFAWDDALGLAIPLLAAIPFFVAVLAYRQTRTRRVLFFAAAFGVFFVKGLAIGAAVLLPDYEAVFDGVEIVADAVILVLFFLGMVKD